MGGKRTVFIKEGDKYNYLTYVSESFRISKATGHKVRLAICLCDCGKIVEILLGNLLKGRGKSCGCKRKYGKPPIHTTHGLTKTKLYGVWEGMIARCNKVNSTAYKWYGGRGIKVCPEWENSVESFYYWAMENGYQEGLSLDREKNHLGYSPENCRWTTRIVQANNTRSNVFYEYKGESKTIAEWARSIDMNVHTFYKRVVRMGWGIELALTTPFNASRSRNMKKYNN